VSVVVNNALVLHGTDLLFGTETYYAWTVRLFVNVRAPTPADTLANYTACSLPGYSDFNLDGSQWAGGIVSPGVALFTYPQLTWVFDPYTSAQQTIFGYVVFGNGKVMYAELFPAPFPIPPAGGQLPLILTWTTEQCAQ
jgi:hypothetical protein